MWLLTLVKFRARSSISKSLELEMVLRYARSYCSSSILDLTDFTKDPLSQYPGYIVYAGNNPYHPLVSQSEISTANSSWLSKGGCRDQVRLLPLLLVCALNLIDISRSCLVIMAVPIAYAPRPNTTAMRISCRL